MNARSKALVIMLAGMALIAMGGYIIGSTLAKSQDNTMAQKSIISPLSNVIISYCIGIAAMVFGLGTIFYNISYVRKNSNPAPEKGITRK